MPRIKIRGWTEEYKCGCISGEVVLKRDLPGYCKYHGNDRRHAHPVLDDQAAQALFSEVETPTGMKNMSDTKLQHYPEESSSSSARRPAFVQIQGVGNKLHALGDDGVIYVMNEAAQLFDGTWEISGADTSDFRFWIPLPSL